MQEAVIQEAIIQEPAIQEAGHLRSSHSQTYNFVFVYCIKNARSSLNELKLITKSRCTKCYKSMLED